MRPLAREPLLHSVHRVPLCVVLKHSTVPFLCGTEWFLTRCIEFIVSLFMAACQS